MKNKGFIGRALLLLGAILALWVVFHIGFIWRAINNVTGASAYFKKGETLDPWCGPSDPRCTVSAVML